MTQFATVVLGALAMLASSAIQSCQPDKCVRDEAFISRYEGYLGIIKAANEGEPVQPYQQLEAIIYLQALTGGEAISDTTDMKQMHQVWKHWLKENKCEMTMEIADSMYYRYTTQ